MAIHKSTRVYLRVNNTMCVCFSLLSLGRSKQKTVSHVLAFHFFVAKMSYKSQCTEAKAKIVSWEHLRQERYSISHCLVS